MPAQSQFLSINIFSCHNLSQLIIAVIASEPTKSLIYNSQLQFKSQLMKSREIVEYLIYPHIFNSFSILYKGVYCISIKLYHLSENKSITHAFPFLVPHPKKPQSAEMNYQQPSLHIESNFSYQTESFYMVYEQDSKRLTSQCVFRLESQGNKNYITYLSCKLMKKVTKQKSSETNLCTRKTASIKYQCIDTQIFELRLPDRAPAAERVMFRSSQFFSSIDLLICRFNYGSKSFKGKDQLSKMLAGYDLSKNNPCALLHQKSSKKQMQQQVGAGSRFTKNQIDSNAVCLAYLDLQEMIEQYNRWFLEIDQFRKRIGSFELFQRQLNPFSLPDLSHLNRGRILKASQLAKLFEAETIEETLICILQEKELLRLNIRALRQHFSTLLFYSYEKDFRQQIKQKTEQLQRLRVKNFVKFQPALTEKDGLLLRNTAGSTYSKQIVLVPQKIERIPVLLVQNYQQPNNLSRSEFTLTVFVHGYQGNSFDFQKSKNYLRRFNRYTHILVAESITDDMNKSIEDLGKAVAQEVKRHLNKTLNNYLAINFVGFSLGGLIVRACLPFLNPQHAQKLGIFVSFSSPHLGISELDNNLVKLGIWFLTKLQKVQNLKELNFQSVQFHDSLLMKLSRCQCISKFKKVVLISSKDDGFVPLYSTILQRSLCEKQILLLCDNLRRQIQRLERIQVMFSTEHAGTIDKLTGRRGHIEFLDNDYFLQLFFKLYASFF